MFIWLKIQADDLLQTLQKNFPEDVSYKPETHNSDLNAIQVVYKMTQTFMQAGTLNVEGFIDSLYATMQRLVFFPSRASLDKRIKLNRILDAFIQTITPHIAPSTKTGNKENLPFSLNPLDDTEKQLINQLINAFENISNKQFLLAVSDVSLDFKEKFPAVDISQYSEENVENNSVANAIELLSQAIKILIDNPHEDTETICLLLDTLSDEINSSSIMIHSTSDLEQLAKMQELIKSISAKLTGLNNLNKKQKIIIESINNTFNNLKKMTITYDIAINPNGLRNGLQTLNLELIKNFPLHFSQQKDNSPFKEPISPQREFHISRTLIKFLWNLSLNAKTLTTETAADFLIHINESLALLNATSILVNSESGRSQLEIAFQLSHQFLENPVFEAIPLDDDSLEAFNNSLPFTRLEYQLIQATKKLFAEIITIEVTSDNTQNTSLHYSYAQNGRDDTDSDNSSPLSMSSDFEEKSSPSSSSATIVPFGDTNSFLIALNSHTVGHKKTGQQKISAESTTHSKTLLETFILNLKTLANDQQKHEAMLDYIKTKHEYYTNLPSNYNQQQTRLDCEIANITVNDSTKAIREKSYKLLKNFKEELNALNNTIDVLSKALPTLLKDSELINNVSTQINDIKNFSQSSLNSFYKDLKINHADRSHALDKFNMRKDLPPCTGNERTELKLQYTGDQGLLQKYFNERSIRYETQDKYFACLFGNQKQKRSAFIIELKTAIANYADAQDANSKDKSDQQERTEALFNLIEKGIKQFSPRYNPKEEKLTLKFYLQGLKADIISAENKMALHDRFVDMDKHHLNNRNC